MAVNLSSPDVVDLTRRRSRPKKIITWQERGREEKRNKGKFECSTHPQCSIQFTCLGRFFQKSVDKIVDTLVVVAGLTTSKCETVLTFVAAFRLQCKGATTTTIVRHISGWSFAGWSPHRASTMCCHAPASVTHVASTISFFLVTRRQSTPLSTTSAETLTKWQKSIHRLLQEWGARSNMESTNLRSIPILSLQGSVFVS